MYVAERLYAQLYAYIHKRSWLLRLTRVVCFALFLGPCRGLVIWYYQKFGRNRPTQIKECSLFKSLDVCETLDNLIRAGFSLGIRLPEAQVMRILEYCKHNDAKRYNNPHRDCDVIDSIARDPKLMEVARRYLGVPPILWGTRMYWTGREKGGATARRGERPYHFDVGDFKCLNVFIYLTDVDLRCGPHVVIEGTHRRKTLWQLINPYLGHDVAKKRHDGRIRILMGPKGIGFFEDMTCYHKHLENESPRLVLVIVYTLRRRPNSPCAARSFV